MDKITELKQELKKINAEAAGIRDLPVEKRAEFGKALNVKRAAVLERIAEAERALMDVEAEPIDITAWSGVNEPLPDYYPAEMGSAHPLMTELDRVCEIY